MVVIPHGGGLMVSAPLNPVLNMCFTQRPQASVNTIENFANIRLA